MASLFSHQFHLTSHFLRVDKLKICNEFGFERRDGRALRVLTEPATHHVDFIRENNSSFLFPSF